MISSLQLPKKELRAISDTNGRAFSLLCCRHDHGQDSTLREIQDLRKQVELSSKDSMEPLADDLQTAMRLHQEGRFEPAERIYRQILQTQPEHPQALHLLAKIDMRRGDHGQAIHYLDRAVKCQPNHPGHHFSLGIAHQAQGSSELAEKSYRQAIALKSDYVQAHQQLGDTYIGLKKYDLAISSYRQAIESDPNNPVLHLNLSIALDKHGHPDEAEQHCRAALALNPEMDQAHVHLGNLLLACQRCEQAIASFKRAAQLSPENAVILNNLGNAFHGQGQFADAVETYHRSLRLAPLDATTHFNLGVALQALDRTKSAIISYRKAVELAPEMVEASDNLGKLLCQEGRLDEAFQVFQRGLKVQPAHIPTLERLASLHMKRKEPIQAEQCYRKIIELEPDNAAAHSSLGFVLLALEKLDESFSSCRQAILLDPNCKEAHLNLVETLLVQGAMEEAAVHCRKALHIDPYSGIAHYHLANLQADRLEEDEISRIKLTLEQENLPRKERLHAHFAMGMICDRREQYDLAFRHFQSGNALRDVSYDPQDHENYFSRLIESSSKEFFEEPHPEGSDSEVPVFIVGMPRSGTTLVEQVLASHPMVHGAGELRLLQNLVERIPDRLALALKGPRIAYSICAPALTENILNDLASEYLEAAGKCSPQALRITDKMPENFHHLGLLALMFPRAKIIHCRRHPLDTCLSCYFQKFTHVPSSFNLEHIGAYYRQYQRLMDHWKRVLPKTIHDVRYEAMIDHREETTRGLLEYCGLPWDDRCLDFHSTRRPVNTASVLQVRQPIYRRSLQRWKHYEKHLGPLKKALGWEADADC